MFANKQCTVCKEVKPRSEFHQAGNSLQGACKPCVVARVTAWRKANPERLARARAASCRSASRARKANPEKYRARDRAFDLKRKYGITVEQYDAMLIAQGGKCKLCGRLDVDKAGRRLAVDHNHATGQVRGLLCAACNFAINRLETVPDWTSKAREYLGVN